MAAIGYRELIADARGRIENLPVAQALALHDDADVLFVDLRDVREVWREGLIPGALHAPRGMLEFWIDPDSPYHKAEFASGKRLVFYCASGWRSALAADTAQRMGLARVAHIDGGFAAWKEAGGAVEERKRK